MHPVAFVDEVIQHRTILLIRFREASPRAFHRPLVEGTWSCEAFFRHLLAGYKWMVDAIPGRYTGWDDNQMYRGEVP